MPLHGVRTRTVPIATGYGVDGPSRGSGVAAPQHLAPGASLLDATRDLAGGATAAMQILARPLTGHRATRCHRATPGAAVWAQHTAACVLGDPEPG